MTTKPRFRAQRMRVFEISVVPAPANPEAKVVLYQGADHPTKEEIDNTMTKEELEVLNKRIAATEATAAESAKTIKAMTDEAEASKKRELALSKMDDAERAHYFAQSAEDQVKFLALSSAKRKTAMRTTDAGADTLVYQGQTVSRAEAGDAQFRIFEAMASDLESTKGQLVTAANDIAAEKIVNEVFAGLPGTLEEQKAAAVDMALNCDPATLATVRKALLAKRTQTTENKLLSAWGTVDALEVGPTDIADDQKAVEASIAAAVKAGAESGLPIHSLGDIA